MEIAKPGTPDIPQEPTPQYFPRYERMTEDLWILNGVNNKVGSTDLTVFTPSEAKQLLAHMSGWAKEKLGISEELEESTRTEEDEEYRKHEIVQEWGAPPAPDEIADKGVVIEMGGPTEDDQSMAELYGVRPSFVSNIVRGEGRQGHVGEIDFVADAGRMPLADRSIGSVFVAHLPSDRSPEDTTTMTNELHSETIAESARVIKPDGYLFWVGGNAADYEEIIRAGFTPVNMRVSNNILEDKFNGEFVMPRLTFTGVFQKAPVQDE